jgi:hypothetical protein
MAMMTLVVDDDVLFVVFFTVKYKTSKPTTTSATPSSRMVLSVSRLMHIDTNI